MILPALTEVVPNPTAGDGTVFALGETTAKDRVSSD
jgi:hypothetical protein